MKNNFKKILTLTLLCLCGMTFAQYSPASNPAPASADNVPWNERTWQDRVFKGTYEDTKTFKHKLPYDLDTFVWAYTAEFAERFRMPKEWIDPGLKGALAVAWRMTTIGNTTCGLSGIANNCWPTLKGQMDIYLDSQVPLPWRYPEMMNGNFIRGISSRDFLPLPSTESKRLEHPAFAKRKEEPLFASGFVYDKKAPNGQNYAIGVGTVVYFDREFETGVVLIGFAGGGVGQITDSAAAIKFFSQNESARTRGVIEEYAHTVTLSQPFMKKLAELYKEQNKPNSEVSQRLYQQYLQKIQPAKP